MRAFNDPSASLESRLGLLLGGLFASRFDMRDQAVSLNQLAYGFKVIPLSRHKFCGSSGVGCGHVTGTLSSVASTNFMSCRLAPSRLQWSHDLAVVEIPPSRNPCRPPSRLQWSHDLAVVEITECAAGSRISPGFNGATTSRSWK